MSKVAKLVTVSFKTRIVVDSDETFENIVEKVKSPFLFKVENELSENIESIDDDLEMPYDEFWDNKNC